MLSLSEQLTYSTVRIEGQGADGVKSIGTAFFFSMLEDESSHVPVLVTNKHVVADIVTGKFFLHLADANSEPLRGPGIPVTVSNFQQSWISHPDPEVDLCVMPVQSVLIEAKSKGVRPYFLSLDRSLIPSEDELAELTALEDVIMVGYPIGIWDSYNNMPVIRKGITATHPAADYEGRREFMVDLACFPGSSGSPVFLYNVGSYAVKDGGTAIGRVKLMGVLYAGPQFDAEGQIQIVNVPTGQTAISISRIPCNLGICIRAERLVQFDALLKPISKADESFN